VNYAARAAGVGRMDKANVARQKCPDLIAVHVETIDCDDASLEILREDVSDDNAGSSDEEVRSRTACR
jgi:nucleotidyltransferase/DNA polymerase involved in DNA repair